MAIQVLAVLLFAVSAGHVQATGACADGEEACSVHEEANFAQLHKTALKRQQRGLDVTGGHLPGPFAFTDGGACSGGAAESQCDAAGWVYCQDARCDDTPVVKNGVLVAECVCWQPQHTNMSIIPSSNAGASCVIDEISPGSGFVKGGAQMCTAMQNGQLISTYGPKGWKPPLVVAECAPKTRWAWCWGAPCSKNAEGVVICDCPMMQSFINQTQYLSLSENVCAEEEDPCSHVHNSSPPGPEDPQKILTKCEK